MMARKKQSKNSDNRKNNLYSYYTDCCLKKLETKWFVESLNYIWQLLSYCLKCWIKTEVKTQGLQGQIRKVDAFSRVCSVR